MINNQVGTRIRLARKMLNLSQEALAERLGVTFQQVQKYEKGASRISASRLHQAALILDLPVSFFFPEVQPASAPARMSEPSPLGSVMDWLGDREGIELNLAFSQISDPKVRRQLVQLAQSIATRSDG